MDHLLQLSEGAAPDVQELLNLVTENLWNEGHLLTSWSIPISDQLQLLSRCPPPPLPSSNTAPSINPTPLYDFSCGPPDLGAELDLASLHHSQTKNQAGRINLLLLQDPSLKARANNFLSKQFAAYPDRPSQMEMETMNMSQKIFALHKIYMNLTYPPPAQFTINVVTLLRPDGRVDNIEPYYLDATSHFPDLLAQLQTATANWQAGNDGHTDGYTLKDGNWLYQSCDEMHVPAKEMYDLIDEQDYAKMRELLNSGKGKGKIGVLIWHERIYSRSTILRKEWADMQPVIDPLDEDGKPYWDPDPDPFDWNHQNAALELALVDGPKGASERGDGED